MKASEVNGLKIKHYGKSCTVVKMRYHKPLERERLARSFPSIAPMLDDYHSGEPSIDDLKNHPEMIKFLVRQKSEEEFTIYLRAENGENVQKAVCLVDDKGKACAVALWEKDSGSFFFIPQ